MISSINNIDAIVINKVYITICCKYWTRTRWTLLSEQQKDTEFNILLNLCQIRLHNSIIIGNSSRVKVKYNTSGAELYLHLPLLLFVQPLLVDVAPLCKPGFSVGTAKENPNQPYRMNITGNFLETMKTKYNCLNVQVLNNKEF